MGVKGFDSVGEAREAVKLKNVYRCKCEECRSNVEPIDLFADGNRRLRMHDDMGRGRE